MLGAMGGGGGMWGNNWNAPPIQKAKVWATDCFVSEFCDNFADDLTTSSDVFESWSSFTKALESLLKKTEENSESNVFSPDVISKARPALEKLKTSFEKSEGMMRKYSSFQQWKMQYYLSKMLDDIAKQVHAMEAPGDLCLFPLLLPELHDSGVCCVIEYVDDEYVRVTIVNPSPLTSYHPRVVGSENPSELQQQVALTVSKVKKSKVVSEAWWAVVMIGAKSLPKEDVFYTHLLSWLTGRTHEGQIAEFQTEAYYSSPCRSHCTIFWISLTHALCYVLRRNGLGESEANFVRHFVKEHLLDRCNEDLDKVKAIKLSSKKLIESALKDTAVSIGENEKLFPQNHLEIARKSVEELHSKLLNMRCDDEGRTPAPPLLDVTNGWDKTQQPEVFPLMESHRRIESVEQFVGAATESARSVPVNFLRINEHVSTLAEALHVMNESVMLITRIVGQSGLVKNQALLILSLLNHTFLEVLPVPLGPQTRSKFSCKCIWSDTPMRYGQQLHLMTRLHQLSEYFMSALFSLDAQMENDGIRITVAGVIAAIADALIRVKATDKCSLFTTHLIGYKGKDGYAYTTGKYAQQTEMIQFLYPEALLARTGILDYFYEICENVPSGNIMWKWEDGVNKQDKAAQRLFRQLAHSEAFPTAAAMNLMASVAEGNYSVLIRQFQELEFYRNVSFWFKYLMAPTFPHKQDWLPMYAALQRWDHRDGEGFDVYSFEGTALRSEARLRYQSWANPSQYCKPHEVLTEDDLLHIKNLTTFDDVMGQRDSELLLSYLTVPYIRIPLVLRFFATEDRVSCLKNQQIQNMLNGVLFEAGRFLSLDLVDVCPQEVPSEKAEYVACPYGLLLNELFYSTDGVIDPVVRLVHLAAELDAGTVYNEMTTNVILFLVRTVARIQNYVFLAMRIQQKKVRTEHLRGVEFVDSVLVRLNKAYNELHDVIQTLLLPMLETWIHEAMRNAVEAQRTDDIDKATALASKLYCHQILILRNVPEQNFDGKFVAMLLSSFAFLTTRYTWQSNVLPEMELYNIIHRHRRAVIKYLSTCDVSELSTIMDSIVKVVTSSNTASGIPWGFLAGTDCVGRFARLDEDVMTRLQQKEKGQPELLATLKSSLGLESLPEGASTIPEGMQEVELNIHTVTLTFKNAHLRALPSEIANDLNVYTVFAPLVGNKQKMLESMQCAIVEDAVNRLWVRLVGQDHDVQYWRTPDPRFPIPNDTSMRFYPDDLAETEKWVEAIFEPIRLAYFERSFWDPPIFILIQEHKLTAENTVAQLSAIDSQSGKKLKEIYVFKDYNCIHTYDIVSHGRRYYRRLVYSSDSRFCLLALQPAVDRRPKPWPYWGRHAAGDPDPDSSTEAQASAVILRHATHPENISNSTETYVPQHFLHGLIPSCLLETHTFWQDPDDNIRGYPIENKDDPNKATHILWIHWREMQFDPTGVKNTCVQVFRYSRAKAAPKASEEAVLRSKKLRVQEDKDEDKDEGEEQEKREGDLEEGGTADLEAGPFRQSSTIFDEKDAATIEDHTLLLVNLMYARKGTPLYSLAKVMARLELLSHVLVWTKKTDYDSNVGGPITLDLIQLPRLKLSFTARLSPDGSEYLIYSMDHAHLFISNLRQPLVTELLQGVPHSLIFADQNGAMSILVPSINVIRPAITTAPFTTELVLNRADGLWMKRLDTRYYLYPVHVSLSFMFTPTLASALYLLLLRFFHRNYQEVFRLSGTIGTDMELTAEEHQIFQKLVFCMDNHPNAFACRSKISLLVSDSPVTLGWYPPDEVANMIHKLSGVTVACKLTQSEERRLLYLCDMLDKKMGVIRDFVKKDTWTEASQLVFQKLQDKTSMTDGTMQQRSMIRKFYTALTTELREVLDVRVVREDLNRLLGIYNAFAQKPMEPYFHCLLHNRRQIIEAEHECSGTGKEKVSVDFKIPPIGDDLRWLFYSDYNPHTVKAPGSAIKQKNDEGRVLTMSKSWDYFYCGGSVRKQNQCRCRGCNEHCGPNTGCPCVSCEKFNNTEGHLVRELIPTLDTSKSTKTLTFFESFMWINEAVGRYAAAKRNKEYPYMERQVPASLREPGNSFLRYYELFTGTTKVKICSADSGRDLASILFHFTREARNPASALGHMMHFVAAHPNTWAKGLTKFNRTSKQKIDQRCLAIYNSIWAQAANFTDGTVPEDFDKATIPDKETREITPRPSTRTVEVPLDMTTILPIPRNTDCTRRYLKAPVQADLRLLGDEAKKLQVDDALLKTLASTPLGPATPQGFAIKLTRKEQGAEEVSSKLPFDLNSHHDARKTVAKDMLKRIEADMVDFANQQNDTASPKLSGLSTEAQVKAVVCGKTTLELVDMRKKLDELYDKVVALRAADEEFLAYAMPVITRTANNIELASNDRLSSILSLRRFAGKEAFLSIDYLLSAMCSDTAGHEWQQLNPFLNEKTCEALFALITITILRANRVGHANRVCEATKDLIGLLKKADNVPEGVDQANFLQATSASTLQKADAVATALLTSRVYVNADDMSYDPRFLLFEFTWNLVLRDRQREQILEMHKSIREGTSSVKQMIMGAGKTTVVGPLLALMLADSTNLVIQVVPPALLDFTRAVLRTTFSSVLQKQIFTFICDRATEVDSEALSKFQHAKQARGIIVTTPSSIKSIFLKYIEGLDRVADDGRQRNVEMEKENVDLLNVLKMWKQGVLIMDEVDMLLHPLKSELNFPIGVKHNIDFTPTRWKLPIHLIDTIFYYHTRRVTTSMKESPDAIGILQKFKAAVKRGLDENALQEMPHLTLLNLEFYEQELKPVLAEWTLLFLKAQHLTGLGDKETIEYIMKRPDRKTQPDFVATIEALEPDHVKMLNLAFEWLNCFMPHVMQKIDRVSFGIMNNDDMKRARDDHPNMPRSRFVTAIPFVGKDLPSQSSEFAHPDIVIGLTILAYRYEGLRTIDFTVILREIHAAVEKEVGRFSQRRTNVMYQKWVQAAGGKILASYDYGKKKKDSQTNGGDDMGMQPSESVVFDEDGNPIEDKIIHVLPLKLMKQANQQEIDKLFKLFKRTAEPIHWYLCETIFPEYMRHQQLKLSASGQELGGNIMFQRRIGFSGTPSDLLPVELGRCGYERGTDGQLIYTLTDPRVMGYEMAETGWTVRSLLDRIANSSFNALIDTGALITGMSNLQVAQYLLKNGIPDKEGVVFLDEFDRKMILVRATGRVLKLAECGIPKQKRFAFYDQVHTTGMDIEHTPNAEAVQTLGKDMTFRDFSQGAYRMRGIAQGQTVKLLIIPEVYDLINRSLKSVRGGKVVPTLRDRSTREVLVDVTSWLLVNSIRSEHTQHNQLCLQSCANVWRKEAYAKLCDKVADFKVAEKPGEEAAGALAVFREVINFEITEKVPDSRMFSEAVSEYVGKHSTLINSEEGQAVVKGIMDQTKREDEVDNPVIDVQMVQEQEEEKEAEQEQEKEQEVEIEKFVDLAYNRDEEHSQSWRIDTLKDPKIAVQFYKLSDFHLYKRRPIDVPDSIMLSKGYFDPKWSGHRRMKNVIVTMEWIPSVGQLSVAENPSNDYGSLEESRGRALLSRTLKMVVDHQEKLSPELVSGLLTTALHTVTNETPGLSDVVDRIIKKVQAGADVAEVFYEELRSNSLRSEQKGRYTVALNLAEAETIRRVIHLKQHKGSIIPGQDVAVALHLTPSGNALLDASASFSESKTAFFANRNYQCLRYFDCDLHYSNAEFGLLLRSLQNNPEKLRQAFFQQVIATRRRARQRWESTPISLLFKMSNAFILLQQRVVGLLIRHELEKLELNLGDAYIAFNNSHSGILTPDELWGSLKFCRLNLSDEEVLDFIDMADTHHEGNIQYPDFICALTGSRDYEEEDSGDSPGDAQGKKLPTVEPFGLVELKTARANRIKIQRQQEAEANKEMEAETDRVMAEIENEQIDEDIRQVTEHGNPLLEETALTFGFNHPDIPKLVVPVGAKVRRPPIDDSKDERRVVEMHSNSGLRYNLRMLKRFNENKSTLNFYCLTIEFRLPKPRGGDGKNGTIANIHRMGKVLNLINWSLNMFRFQGYSNVGAPQFEVDIYGVNPGNVAGDGDVDRLRRQLDDRNLSYGDRQRIEEQMKRKTKTSSSGGGSGGNSNEIIHVFAEAKPGKDEEDFLHEIKVGEIISATGKKTNNSIEGITYEWIQISQPVEGWIVKEKNGKSYWEQLGTALSFAEKGFVVDHSPVGSSAQDHAGTFDETVEEENDDGTGKKKEEDDIDDDHPVELTNDVGDLLEALRKAKRLKPGDKVTRNRDQWDKGNEDGGAGNVGKVLKVETDKVQVQWPSGNKGHYLFGSKGVFELIKVGEADDDDDGEQRETMNDERWLPELRKGGKKCGECGALKLEPQNWFRCNHCEDYHLCKKCFRGGHHSEHDFTDMNALSNAKNNEVAPGSYVRIKLSVTNPKYGWDGCKAGDRGVVLEVDHEDNWATVEMENDESEWRGDLDEIELTEGPDEENNEEGATRTIPFSFIMSMDPAPSNTPFLSALLETAREQREGKYKVGDRVKVKRGGSMYPGEIRAILPNKQYAANVEGYGYQSNIEEYQILPLAVKVGDRVRYIRGKKSFVYGPPSNWTEKDRDKNAGTVTQMRGGGSDYVKVVANFESNKNVNMADKDIEVVGNGKWTFTRTLDGQTDVIPLPTSSNVMTERAFEDGTQIVQVFIRDDMYTIDFATNEVKRGNNVVGKVARDPPATFLKGEAVTKMDDGNPHVVSILVREDQISIFCDGRPTPVSFTGALQSIKDKDRYKKALGTSLALQSNIPLMVLHSQVSSEMAKATIGSLGPTFPMRHVHWMRLDWSRDLTPEEIEAHHMVIEVSEHWTCRECGTANSRQLDACDKCKAPRISKKQKKDDKNTKFRAAMAKSRDAQAVRSKLQGKLRAQYQRELDHLDELAQEATAKSSTTGGGDGLRIGNLPAAGPQAQ